jgi:hypothetical protein
MTSKHHREKELRDQRGLMRSPGRPPIAQRQQRVLFSLAIAEGLSSSGAADRARAPQPIGTRWFRNAGGMPPLDLGQLSGRFLSLGEREEIAVLHAQKLGVRAIGKALRRAPSSISRELRRNASTRPSDLPYRASTAQWHTERRATRPKTSKVTSNDRLWDYVQQRLAGHIAHQNGSAVVGP